MALTRTAVATLLALLGALAFLTLALGRDVDYCLSTDEYPYLFFASKTVYEFSRTRSRGDEIPTHCVAQQVWWLNRHGTRYPGKSTIKKMESLWTLRNAILRNHQEGTGRLCDADLDGLSGWQLRVNESLDNLLTASGEEELFLTARRLRELFPEALQQPYTAARYKFRHTDSQRTEMSARKFAQGLFDSSDAVHIPPALKDDKLLQPYASCNEWLERDKSDPEEWRKLVDGNMMKTIVANVSGRLGFRADLKYEDINTIYDMCRFDKAWNVDKTSFWCAAFSKEELKFLEYAEDLRYYYKSGYGDDMNIKLGCPLAKDLVERFTALAAGAGEQPAGVFYFAHSSTLHMLQARLGVYRDAAPLRADGYEQQRGRRWRVSRMGSFAANLGAVFYRCSPPGEAASQKVLFLAGEAPLDVDGCKVGLCSWEHVKNLLQPLAEQCDLQWCDGAGGAASRRAAWGALLLALALALAHAAP